MNGPHDLGGQMGFGAVAPEHDEPMFHGAWEKRAMAITLACGGMRHWSIDESRHMRENLHPADYYASSYYEIWIKALERLLKRHGFVSEEELAAGHALLAPIVPNNVLSAADVPSVLARGGPTSRRLDAPARFKPGDCVRTINIHPTGHTRLPRYARFKNGVVALVHEPHVFADTHSRLDGETGRGEHPQWLYGVEFKGTELWGADADPTLVVGIDAWESYLEPA